MGGAVQIVIVRFFLYGKMKINFLYIWFAVVLTLLMAHSFYFFFFVCF